MAQSLFSERSMPFKKSPSLFLPLLALLPACGPMVPLSYQPEGPRANIAQTIELPEVTITLEYLQLKNGYHIFDLEVINLSSTTIQVAPQTITFYASPKLFPPLLYPTDDVHSLSAPNSILAFKRVFGSSPTDIRRIYKQKAKKKEVARVFLCILRAGLIIYDEVKDAQDSQKETWTIKDQQKAAGRDFLVDAAITATQITRAEAYQASEDNYYLPYALLPECGIEPGNSVRGKVFIRSEGSHRYARLVVPLTETDYVFDLKRRGVKSRMNVSAP